MSISNLFFFGKEITPMWCNSMETNFSQGRQILTWSVFVTNCNAKKKFRQHKIDHDLYRKQKSVGGALIPKFMPHTKSHMASLCSVKITIAVYIYYRTVNSYLLFSFGSFDSSLACLGWSRVSKAKLFQETMFFNIIFTYLK